jgi:hypothetical protein
MKLKGPYVTLVGGLAIAGVLLALSNNAVTKDENLAVANASDSVTAPADTADPAATGSPDESGDAAADESADDQESDDVAAPAVEPTPPGTYAGSVKGGGASIAIAVKGKTAIAYVCDGKKVEAWMQGSAADGTALSLKGKGGSKVNATYTDGKLSGTVRAAGKKWSFGVKTVKAPSGLYRSARNVRQAKVVGGWIVYQGNQVGMLNTDGVETPAPPIDLRTGKVTINGTAVQADAVDGSSIG